MLWLVVVALGLRLWGREITGTVFAAYKAWMDRPAGQRRAMLVTAAVCIGGLVAVAIVCGPPTRSGDDVLSSPAFYFALERGLSEKGAREYVGYLRRVGVADDVGRSLVKGGGLAQMPGTVTMPPEDFLRQHPEFVRTAAEEARWDPRFRAHIAGVPPVLP